MDQKSTLHSAACGPHEVEPPDGHSTHSQQSLNRSLGGLVDQPVPLHPHVQRIYYAVPQRRWKEILTNSLIGDRGDDAPLQRLTHRQLD